MSLSLRLVCLAIISAGVMSLRAASIQNPWHAEADWKLWYEDQAPATFAKGTIAPIDVGLRRYPVDPSPSEAADGLYYKTVVEDYPGRIYAGLYLDTYGTADKWHTTMPAVMSFDGGNVVQVAGIDGGNAGKPSQTYYQWLDYNAVYGAGGFTDYGILFANQSTTGMGHDQVRWSSLTIERDYAFKNLLYCGPRYTSGWQDYPALLPVFFNGNGASYNQLGGYAKMFYAGAYLPLETKRAILRNGLYTVTSLYNWKASLPYQVPYDHHLRHRVSYEVNGLARGGTNQPQAYAHLLDPGEEYDSNRHFANMVAQYKDMDLVPPVCVLEAVSIDQGAWNSAVYDASQLKTLIALKPPTGGGTVEAVVSTAGSYDLQGYPLSIRPKLLYGDKRTSIVRESEHQWRITVPWNADLPKGRTDIIFVANNGVYDSNPAVVSVYRDSGVSSERVREITGLPRQLRVLRGEQLRLPLYSEDKNNRPVSYYLLEGLPGYLDGNELVIDTSTSAVGDYPMAVIAANELTGDSVNGIKGSLEVRDVLAEGTVNISRGLAPLLVDCSGLASRDIAGEISSFSWDFDDGTSASGAAVQHQFATPGMYRVGLTVTGPSGSDTSYQMIQVDPSQSWGLALDRGWTFSDGSTAAALDSSVWSLSGTAPTFSNPTDNNGTGSITILGALTSVADFDLPLFVEAEFSYKDTNSKRAHFDFFGHRIGFMKGHAADVPRVGEEAVPTAADSYLGFAADFGLGTEWSRHIGAIDTSGKVRQRLYLSLRADPAHAGKMLISGTVAGFDLYVDNLDMHSQKLALLGWDSSQQFQVSRYQVWTPTGNLLRGDLQLTYAGAVLWNDRPEYDHPYAAPVLAGLDLGIADQPGAVLSRRYTITNRGTAPVNLTGDPLVVVTSWRGYNVSQQPAVTSLAPGESTDFTVQFTDSSTGDRTGDLRIAHDAYPGARFEAPIRARNALPTDVLVEGNGLFITAGAGTVHLADHTRFSETAVGDVSERDFLLRNRGTMPLTIGNVSISGSAAFSIVHEPRNSLTNFGSSLLRIRYAPTTAGADAATVTVSSNDADTPSYSFAIAGEAVAATDPAIVVEHAGEIVNAGAAIDLGAVALGERGSLDLVLQVGSDGGDLHPGAVELTGDPVFYVVERLPHLIPDGCERPLTVRFVPPALGSYAATLRIPCDDPEQPVYELQVSAAGSADADLLVLGQGVVIADGDVDPQTADGTKMGRALLGEYVEQTYTLRNVASSGMLTINDISVQGDHAADFSVISMPDTIAPQSNADLVIRCAPSAIGLRQATVTISSNTLDGSYDFALSAQASVFNQYFITPLPDAFYAANLEVVDYDADGDYDVIGIGGYSVDPYVIRNNAGTLSVEMNSLGLPDLYNGVSASWTDIDSDGDIDLALSDAWSYSCDVYRNSLGSFSGSEVFLGTDRASPHVAFGDIDQDGDDDLVVTGRSYNGNDFVYAMSVYQNHEGAYSLLSEELPGSYMNADGATLELLDMDMDGDLDLLVDASYFDGIYKPGVRIYENREGALTSTEMARFDGHFAVRDVDIDADGDPDLMLIPYYSSSATPPTMQLVRNNAGVLSLEDTGLQSYLTYQRVLFADMDANGYPDLVVSGTINGERRGSIYYNQAGTLGGLVEELGDIGNGGDMTVLDYDQDGDLDILQVGYLENDTINAVLEVIENIADFHNQAPATPVAPSASFDNGVVQVAWSAPSDDSTPAAGLSYELRISSSGGDGDIRSGNADASGWRLLTGPGPITRPQHALHLPVGSYQIQVQAIDAGWQGSAWSAAVSVEVFGPSISGWSDDTGISDSDAITNDTDISVNGSTEAGATVRLFVNDVERDSVLAADGSFVLNTGALSDGSHVLTAQTELDGQTSAMSEALQIVVDTTAELPVITSLHDRFGLIDDAISRDATVQVQGSSEVGAQVQVQVDGLADGSTTADASGAWTYTTSALADGAHDITASIIDLAGNASAPSAAVSVTVDTSNQVPGQPSDVDAAGSLVQLPATVGTTVGITVEASDGDGDPVSYLLTDDADGRFAIDASSGVVSAGRELTVDDEGEHLIGIAASDGADTGSTASFTIVLYQQRDPGLQAMAVSHEQIHLTWNDQPLAHWYLLQRKLVDVANQVRVIILDNTADDSYQDRGLDPAMDYTYRLDAGRD